MNREFYWVNGSIASWRVQLVLHEKGLAFEPRRVRVMGEHRETRTPEFLALNPRGQAPVLVDGPVVINESLAIMTYLELRYPEPTLLPRDAEVMARVLACVQESETTAIAYEPLEQLFVLDDATPSPDQRSSLAGALAAIDRELSLWEDRLAVGPFLVGSALTLADCAFYPVVAYLARRGLTLGRWPRLCAYANQMAARPAAVASHPHGWRLGRVQPDLFARAHALAVT